MKTESKRAIFPYGNIRSLIYPGRSQDFVSARITKIRSLTVRQKSNSFRAIDSARTTRSLRCYSSGQQRFCSGHVGANIAFVVAMCGPTALMFWPLGGQHRSCFGQVRTNSSYVFATCGPTALMFWPRVCQRDHVLAKCDWNGSRDIEKCIKMAAAQLGVFCLASAHEPKTTSRDTYINLEPRIPTPYLVLTYHLLVNI